MDITYISGQEKFNYRVCAVIVSGGKILAMRDERSPYFYLPGGRVRLGETAEHAVIREVEEELRITPRIIRPLWLNQGFFTEDVDQLRYHELCLYFLMDVSGTGLLDRGNGLRFTRAATNMILNGSRSSACGMRIFTRSFSGRPSSICPSSSPSGRNTNNRVRPAPA